MQNPAEADLSTGKNLLGPFKGKVADCDEPFGLKDSDDIGQVFVASREQCGAFWRWQFVGGAVTPAPLHKSERAIVHDYVLLEKILGRTESFGEEPPQPFAADLAALASESGHKPLGMLIGRMTNFGFDPEPIAHSTDLPERDAGLDHAEGAGVHPKKDHAFGAVGVTLQVRFVRGPGVIEWVINVCNRRRERELAHHPLEILGGLD